MKTKEKRARSELARLETIGLDLWLASRCRNRADLIDALRKASGKPVNESTVRHWAKTGNIPPVAMAAIYGLLISDLI